MNQMSNRSVKGSVRFENVKSKFDFRTGLGAHKFGLVLFDNQTVRNATSGC